MPNIKPLRKDYKSVKELYSSFSAVYKNLVYYACDGDNRFATGVDKVTFDSLSDTEVKELIMLTLSYGLKTNEDEFKSYITTQYSKGPSSILKSLVAHDIDHIKLAINDQKFQSLINSICFNDKTTASSILNKLKTRIGKMKSDELPPAQETDLLNSLIQSILDGKNVAPDGTVIEDQ